MFLQVIEKMERETGLEPATSSLGIQASFESKTLARFCCEILNLQHLAESVFSDLVRPIEAQMRQTYAKVYEQDNRQASYRDRPFERGNRFGKARRVGSQARFALQALLGGDGESIKRRSIRTNPEAGKDF
jgi:hypothetical protein